MPIIVLLHLGGSTSPSASYVGNFMTALRLADAALATIPEGKRLPRPFVIGPTRGEEKRAANVIAGTFLLEPGENAALESTPDADALSRLVARCLATDHPIIIVTNATIIKAFLAEIASASGRAAAGWPSERPIPSLGLAIDTDTLETRSIKIPDEPAYA